MISLLVVLVTDDLLPGLMGYLFEAIWAVWVRKGTGVGIARSLLQFVPTIRGRGYRLICRCWGHRLVAFRRAQFIVSPTRLITFEFSF
jgi:hypothetical protein